MKKQIVVLLICLTLLLGLLPAMALAGETVWQAQTITDGTQDEPVVITVDGTVTVNGTITIASGSHVKIVGNPADGADMLKRGADFEGSALIVVEGGAYAALNNLTLDGGAVWTGIINETLKRGTVNSGVTTGGSLVSYTGNVTISNCVLQNNGTDSWVINSMANGCSLTMTNSKVINNNGGAFWTRTTLNVNKTEIAYNKGGPSVLRPCGGSTITLSACDIHNNYSDVDNHGTIWSYQATVSFIDNTKVYGNVAQNASNLFTSNGGTFKMINSSVTGNIGASCGGVQTEGDLHLENAVISGNKHTGETGSDNVNIVYWWKTFKIGGSTGEVYLSTPSATGEMPTFQKIDANVDLSKAAGQFHYEGNIGDDLTVLPFVKADGSAIQFAVGKLNGGQELPFTTLPVDTLPTPAKQHSTFVNWYTKDGSETYDWGEKATGLTAGTTYYAQWNKSSQYDEENHANQLFFESDYGTDQWSLTASSPDNTIVFIKDNNAGKGVIKNVIIPNNRYLDVQYEQDGDRVTITPKSGLNLNAGTYTETAWMIMDDESDHNVDVTLTVHKADAALEAVTLDKNHLTATYGDTISLTVKVAKAPAKARSTTADTVSISYKGTLLDEATVVYDDATCSSGVATLTYDTNQNAIPVGDGHVIDVAYGGSINLLNGSRTVTLDLKPIAYSITEGAQQAIDLSVSQDQPATFVSNADFAKFVKVQVDGNDVHSSNYTVVSGSTKVTLKAAYVSTLTPGVHTMTIVSTDGVASCPFTVLPAPAAAIPQTGDESTPLVWLALLVMSGCCMALLNRKRKSA